jgi:hypothetical protein
MSLTQQKYDDPNYTTVEPYVFVTTAGSGNKSPLFTSFAARLVKSVSVKPTTASTSVDTIYLYQVSGTSTTTNTLGTLGSAASAMVNFPCGAANSPTGIALNSGDTFYVQKGTDATVVYAGEIETRMQVGANLTL